MPQFLLRSRLQYAGTVRLFCNERGSRVRYAFFEMVRWYGTLVRCLNLPTKRFMCYVRPSMKICATVPGMRIV